MYYAMIVIKRVFVTKNTIQLNSAVEFSHLATFN